MSFRAKSLVAGMILLLFPVHASCEEEPPRETARSSVQSTANAFLRIGEMADVATDLRKAAEALERFDNSPDGLVGRIATSLATMSSEFDPFGYKTAFRTVGQQAEIIQQQSEIIQALQEREIERLASQNRQLKKELRKLRQPTRSRDGDSK